MPVYNGGAPLKLAVLSILRQSYTNFELILLDDGSTDGSVEALRIVTDPRLRIVSDGRNLGLAARLNEIVAGASGSLLARMDHDDIAHPERFARQVAFLVSHPEVHLLGARCVSMSEDEKIVGELPFAEAHSDIARRPWHGFHLAHPTWMGRIEWFRRHLYAEPAPYCCEDQELLLRAHLTSRYHALPESLLAYRVRTRVPLRKLFRTRRALAIVQLRYFYSAGRYGDAILAVSSFLARTTADLLRKLFPRLRSDVRPLGAGETATWSLIIAAVGDQAEVGSD